MRNILIYVGIVLLIIWGIEVSLHLVGSIIHFVLVLAVVMFVFHFLRGNRSF